jgi:uncharacterized membrane protein YqjE
MISADELRERSTSDLVKQLSQQASALARQEIQLAKAEVREKAAVASAGVGALGAAAVAGLLALGALTACLILVLDDVMPAWTAALCVTALWAVVAVALALFGRQRLREMETPVPEKTLESLKEDVQWLRHPTN